MTANMPDFLIVGAMKSGTTTLYYDLANHPDLHLPANKEPEILVRLSDPQAILDAYGNHFRNARKDQICGEASTAYTKRPLHDGVACRALSALGPDVKIIYIVRDPVDRAVSQYQHELQHGDVSGPFSRALASETRFIDFGRYDWQIAPWKEAFGDEQVMVVHLEEYTTARDATLRDILRFIGADPKRLGGIDDNLVANAATEPKAVPNKLLKRLVHSSLYQDHVKSRIPRTLREGLRRLLLPKPEVMKIEVDAELANQIREESTRAPRPE